MVFPNDHLRSVEYYPKIMRMAAATKESLKVPLDRLKPQEKMPPRFNTKGMSVAVRVLGHEIRHFTHKTTGKDLANLRHSCPHLLRKLGQLAKDSKFSFSAFPNFEFPNRNLNEVDFNGHSSVYQFLDSFCLSENRNKFQNVSETLDESHFDVSSENLLYPWRKHRITEHEFDRLKSLFNTTKNLFQNFNNEKREKEKDSDDWNLYMKMEHFKVWRKKLKNDGPYVFRIHGAYDDITAKSFFQTQNDIEYRSIWDSYALAMNVVDKDGGSDCEVVRWTTKCPYPMNSREYLFVRNSKVYDDENVAVLVCRATEHPNYPESDDFVRVRTYESQMAIRPYKEFDKNGMEFVLVYCDDPQTYLPSYLVDMITSSGISEMMSRLHDAAKNLNEVKKNRYSDNS